MIPPLKATDTDWVLPRYGLVIILTSTLTVRGGNWGKELASGRAEIQTHSCQPRAKLFISKLFRRAQPLLCSLLNPSRINLRTKAFCERMLRYEGEVPATARCRGNTFFYFQFTSYNLAQKWKVRSAYKWSHFCISSFWRPRGSQVWTGKREPSFAFTPPVPLPRKRERDQEVWVHNRLSKVRKTCDLCCLLPRAVMGDPTADHDNGNGDRRRLVMGVLE